MKNQEVEFDINIIFDVPKHAISAYTLADSSSQFIIMLEEINKYVLFESDIKIYVLPYETGSFCKKLKIYAVKHILTPFIENASKQLGTAVVIGLGLLIYGSTHSDKEQIIINNNGGLVRIYNNEILDELKNNKRFSAAKSNYFLSLSKDKDVNQVTFKSANAIVEVPRTAYKQNIMQEEMITEIQESDIKELTVVAPVLEAIDKQWSFKLESNIRSFTMQDKIFGKRVSKGEFQFKHGDKIEAIVQNIYSLEKDEKKLKKINILKVKKFNGNLLDNQMEFDYEQNKKD